MLRKTALIAGFVLALGLAGCAPPSDDAKVDGTETTELTDAEKAAAAEEAAKLAEERATAAEAEAAKAKEEAAAAKAAAAKQRPRPVEQAQPAAPVVCNECGVVASINVVKEKAAGSGAGAVIGAIAGGVIGHQFGGGSGKDVATAAGAIGGGFAGNEVEKRVRATTYYAVGVNMENGSFQTVNVADPAGISVGSRVRVVGGNLQPR